MRFVRSRRIQKFAYKVCLVKQESFRGRSVNAKICITNEDVFKKWFLRLPFNSNDEFKRFSSTIVIGKDNFIFVKKKPSQWLSCFICQGARTLRIQIVTEGREISIPQPLWMPYISFALILTQYLILDKVQETRLTGGKDYFPPRNAWIFVAGFSLTKKTHYQSKSEPIINPLSGKSPFTYIKKPL